MNDKELKDILSQHKKWLTSNGTDGKRADLHGANLRDADLQRADLHGANLRRANLRHADLRDADLHGAKLLCADLQHADLRYANLQSADLDHADLHVADLHGANLYNANLRGANLSGANLSCANLLYADLQDAYLRGADIDYSCIPLWCGSLGVRIDTRIAAQLLYHTLRAMESCADDPDVAAVLESLPVVYLANQFHRINECGAIRVRNNEGGAK